MRRSIACERLNSASDCVKEGIAVINFQLFLETSVLDLKLEISNVDACPLFLCLFEWLRCLCSLMLR